MERAHGTLRSKSSPTGDGSLSRPLLTRPSQPASAAASVPSLLAAAWKTLEQAYHLLLPLVWTTSLPSLWTEVTQHSARLRHHSSQLRKLSSVTTSPQALSGASAPDTGLLLLLTQTLRNQLGSVQILADMAYASSTLPTPMQSVGLSKIWAVACRWGRNTYEGAITLSKSIIRHLIPYDMPWDFKPPKRTIAAAEAPDAPSVPIIPGGLASPTVRHPRKTLSSGYPAERSPSVPIPSRPLS